MKQNKQTKSGPSMITPGYALIMVVLFLVCLTLFAVLTLSSAIRNHNFSTENAELVSAYYTAEEEAVKLQARYQQMLSNLPEDADPEEFYRALEQGIDEVNRLSEYSNLESTALITEHAFVSDQSIRTISYAVPIGESSQLSVVLEVSQSYGADQDYYYIKEWKETATDQWTGDDQLPVLGSHTDN